MQLWTLILVVFATAFLFFGLIPGVGAFAVRAQWRGFRRRSIEASLLPLLRYSDLAAGSPGSQSYRIFGALEAIHGENRIWLNSGSFSVEVELGGVRLYSLPSFPVPGGGLEALEQRLPDEVPGSMSWSQLFSLPAGTRMFVGGRLFREQGRAVFRTQPREPLLVVIYDGQERSFLPRAIWGGRQRNEYWNQSTLASLLTGSFCLLLLAYLLLQTPALGPAALLALSLAFFPVAALLPPGAALYFLYRYFWRTARRLRAERDLLRLPLRYFPDRAAEPERLVRLPGGEPYIMTRDDSFVIQGELDIRGSSLPRFSGLRSREYTLFGRYEETPHALREPEDPMGELVLVLGSPAELAAACARRARLFELLAAVLIFSAIGCNLFLILLLWHQIIR